MGVYSRTHLNDHELLCTLRTRVAQDRATTADLLADIAEVDMRRLFVPAGFSSMRDYCVGVLRLSEDAAYKRIHAARAARDFPAIFTAVAEGRLHLAGVCLLAPHLTAENAQGLLAVAEHQTKAEIERLIAERFPKSEMLGLVEAVPGSTTLPNDRLAPGPIEPDAPERVGESTNSLAPGQVEAPAPRSTMKPHAPGAFALRLVIGQRTHDRLRYAQELLSHRNPSGDLAEAIDQLLDIAIPALEKRKFAATTKPRRGPRRASANPRHIPAHVKNAVWERDGGQCTFVGESGHRCSERRIMEFDHVDPVARGGGATVANLRLRCRVHNQYAAECTFGAGFMDEKRREARRVAQAKELARAEAARAAAEQAAAQAQERAVAEEQSKDLICGLRNLGFRADQARRAAESTAAMTDATLEERIRAALKMLCPKRSNEGRGGTAVAVST
jgi:hypothetical protein